MKNNIEKKILVPFMILLMVSILIILIVFIVNGYNLLLNNNTNISYQNLEEMILIIEKVSNDIKNDIEAKAFVINYYKALGKNNLIIFSDDEILLNTAQNNNFIEDLMNEE